MLFQVFACANCCFFLTFIGHNSTFSMLRRAGYYTRIRPSPLIEGISVNKLQYLLRTGSQALTGSGEVVRVVVFWQFTHKFIK